MDCKLNIFKSTNLSGSPTEMQYFDIGMVIRPHIHLKEPVTILLSLAFFCPISVQLFCCTHGPVPQICHKLTTFPFKNVLSLLDAASMAFCWYCYILSVSVSFQGTRENKHIANAECRQYLYALPARSWNEPSFSTFCTFRSDSAFNLTQPEGFKGCGPVAPVMSTQVYITCPS